MKCQTFYELITCAECGNPRNMFRASINEKENYKEVQLINIPRIFSMPNRENGSVISFWTVNNI